MSTTGKPVGRPPKDAREKAVVRQITFTPAAWGSVERAADPGDRSRLIVRSLAETLQPGSAALGRALLFRDLPGIAVEIGGEVVRAEWRPLKKGWELRFCVAAGGRLGSVAFADDELAEYPDTRSQATRRRVAEALMEASD